MLGNRHGCLKWRLVDAGWRCGDLLVGVVLVGKTRVKGVVDTRGSMSDALSHAHEGGDDLEILRRTKHGGREMRVMHG